MTIQQLSVFIENKSGTLQKVLNLLKEAGIQLIASTSLNRRASAPLCLEDMALWVYSPGKGRRSG